MKPLGPPSTKTAEQVRSEVLAGRKRPEGIVCEGCGRVAKLYRRPLNSSVALWLKCLVDLAGPNGATWVHVRDIGRLADRRGGSSAASSGQGPALLKWWGLVEARPGRRGAWRPTPKGLAFVRGEIAVPKVALVYADTFEGHEGPLVSFRDVIGSKFDLGELLSPATRQVAP